MLPFSDSSEKQPPIRYLGPIFVILQKSVKLNIFIGIPSRSGLTYFLISINSDLALMLLQSPVMYCILLSPFSLSGCGRTTILDGLTPPKSNELPLHSMRWLWKIGNWLLSCVKKTSSLKHSLLQHPQ